METIEKTMPRINIHIVGNDDHYYGISVKDSLQKKFGSEVFISIFTDSESCLHLIMNGNEQPDIVLLDYSENKELNKENGDHVMDYIQKINKNISIIILSDPEDADRAIKSIGYGATHFVVKDQFAHDHIFNAVEKCLYPSKV